MEIKSAYSNKTTRIINFNKNCRATLSKHIHSYFHHLSGNILVFRYHKIVSGDNNTINNVLIKLYHLSSVEVMKEHYGHLRKQNSFGTSLKTKLSGRYS